MTIETSKTEHSETTPWTLRNKLEYKIKDRYRKQNKETNYIRKFYTNFLNSLGV